MYLFSGRNSSTKPSQIRVETKDQETKTGPKNEVIEKQTDKFDVLRGRLLGNHNHFHWQLGGQINHQPCSYKAARVTRCTELDCAVC